MSIYSSMITEEQELLTFDTVVSTQQSSFMSSEGELGLPSTTEF